MKKTLIFEGDLYEDAHTFLQLEKAEVMATVLWEFVHNVSKSVERNLEKLYEEGEVREYIDGYEDGAEYVIEFMEKLLKNNNININNIIN